jgi:Lamin Tail Domain
MHTWFTSHLFQPVVAVGFLFASAFTASAGLVINEIDADQTGTDTTEFIELYNTAGTAMSLDGYAIVLFNGNGDNTYTPVLSLQGKSTRADGYFVIAQITSATATPPAYADMTFVAASGSLQNGAEVTGEGDAIALYQGDVSSVPARTLISAMPAGAVLIDAVVYDGGATLVADDLGLMGGFGFPVTGGFMKHDTSTGSVGRRPNGGPALDITRFDSFPIPSPGGNNTPADQLNVTVTSAALTEGQAAISGTVTRVGSIATEAIVTLTTDATELIVPATILIPAGQASVSFSVGIADDLWPDGPQVVTIKATALSYLEGNSTGITVADNDTTLPALVINEVYASGLNDPNKDGNVGINTQAAFDDEFIELVNTGATDLDLSGYQIINSARPLEPRITIASGMILRPGCAAVVFGGGVPIGLGAAFGNALLLKATAASGGTYLVDNAYLSLRDAQGRELGGVSLGVSNVNDFSQTRTPELTGAFANHPERQADGLTVKFSPGVKADGTSYCATVPGYLTLTTSVPEARENDGTSVTLTITRSVIDAFPATLYLAAPDVTVATLPAQAIIPANQASVTVPITIIDNAQLGGDTTATLGASSSLYLGNSIRLRVIDNETTQPLTTQLFINEVDSDLPGAESDEFIELYVGDHVPRQLDDYFVVLYNGGDATNRSYRAAFDLDKKVTNDQGYFLINKVTFPTLTDGWLQNGIDAIVLYKKSLGAVVSNFSASNQAPSTLGMVDGVIYGTTTGVDTNNDLATVFTTFDGSYTMGNFVVREGVDNAPNKAISRVPDAISASSSLISWTSQAPTPGATNGTGASGYALWAATHPGLGDITADLDYDGVNNLAEYALGGHPLDAKIAPTPRISLGATGQFRIAIPRSSDSRGDDGIVVNVQATTNLLAGSWSSLLTRPISEESTQTLDVYEYAPPTLGPGDPPAPLPTHLYFRVLITLP